MGGIFQFFKIQKFKKKGQATIEYLMVLVIISLIGIQFVKNISGFMGDTFGSFADVLSSHLTVGVCQSRCFFGGYENGFTPSGN